MRTPCISVILPVRNGEPYIAESISSVLAQTLADFELLVIDDGSSDATEAIVRELQNGDSRIKLFRNPGVGLIDALNHGIACASAELIARMDADDICLPERFHRQYEFIDSHPEIAVVGTQVRFIDEHGAPTGEKMALPEAPQAVAEILLKGCCLRHPTVLMRKAALERVGRYRQALVYAEDYDLWLRLSEHYLLANLPDALLLYRVHAEQISERKEWSQRLARNLALLAAIERRAGREDPIGSYACFEKGSAGQSCRRLGCESRVCESVRAFANAERALFQRAPLISRQEVQDTLRYLSKNSLGDGQRSRVNVLVALCMEAVRIRAPLELTATLALALRIHPGRTLRGLVRGCCRQRQGNQS